MSHRIRMRMDGKGRALDNIFVERLWRTVKYENLYNNRREHSSLAGNYPAEVSFGKVSLNQAA